MKTTAEIVTARLREMSKETFSNSLSDLKPVERESVKQALNELHRMLLNISENIKNDKQVGS
ncbi:MAG: hypothetical protein K2X77_31860 [Candidatus Obscuribacterales bacterium]|jgi:hypothetical protein|nr:hypothetical protein [Candidatus Obscuribacterales bacterium]